ncbi:MAG: hypothetical protein ACE5Q6_16980 [Dehalococcoidia bacterium]
MVQTPLGIRNEGDVLAVPAVDSPGNQVMEKALGWIMANLDFFNPLIKVTQIEERRIKAFSELLIMAKLMMRYGGEVSQPPLSDIIGFAENILGHPTFEHGIRRAPMDDTFRLLRMYIDRETWYGPDPQKRQEIQQGIDADLVFMKEAAPFQTMELLDSLEYGGYRHQLPDYSSLYRQSVAYRLPSVLSIPHFDTYVITHVLFYLSDWGLGDPAPVLEDRIEDTYEFVKLMLGLALRDHDWDLVAELLMCFRCLNRPPGLLADLAWQGLAGAQTEGGNIPNTKRFDPSSLLLRNPETAAQYEFDTTYHSTLVTILAGLFAGPRSISEG